MPIIAIRGSLAKSNGITTLAGAKVSDFVRQKWALRPARPINTSHDKLSGEGMVILPSYPEQIRPKIICKLVRKNKILVRESVSVSFRVIIADAAKPIAAVAAAIIPILKEPISGLATTKTPIKPKVATHIFLQKFGISCLGI